MLPGETGALPINLFAYCVEMAQRVRCFVHFHMHGTMLKEAPAHVQSRCHTVIDAFRRLQLDAQDTRTNYDLGFTFTWKKCKAYCDITLYMTNIHSFSKNCCMLCVCVRLSVNK